MRWRFAAVVVTALAVTSACGSTAGPSEDRDAAGGIHPDDQPELLAACVRDEGFAVTVEWHGGLTFDKVPDAQAEDLEAAVDHCHDRYPLAPEYLQMPDEAQLRWLYDWYLDDSIPCLEAEGYEGFDPPSVEVFLDQYWTDPWTPYLDIEERLGPGAVPEEVERRCPQRADVDALLEARED